MSGRVMIGRALLAAGALLVLILGLSAATPGRAAVPVPQATTVTASPSPSPSASEAEEDPGDEMTDDGSNATPAQTGTWLAVGAAAALSVAAGLVVALRKR